MLLDVLEEIFNTPYSLYRDGSGQFSCAIHENDLILLNCLKK